MNAPAMDVDGMFEDAQELRAVVVVDEDCAASVTA
jgi:hypothetical protein